MSGYCEECGNTICICNLEEDVSDFKWSRVKEILDKGYSVNQESIREIETTAAALQQQAMASYTSKNESKPGHIEKPRVEDEFSPREFWMLGKDIIGNTCIAHMTKPNDETLEYHIHAVEYSAYEAVRKQRDEALANYKRKSNNGEAIKQELLKLQADNKALIEHYTSKIGGIRDELEQWQQMHMTDTVKLRSNLALAVEALEKTSCIPYVMPMYEPHICERCEALAKIRGKT